MEKLHWKSEAEGFASGTKKPLIVILGPTASGKTSFSLKVAEFLRSTGKQVEVVNADSRQFYKGMDIGTAKVSREERAAVPHHLIDVLEPNESVSIAWYAKQATKTIDSILERGSVPMLVGGSMLYISAVIDGLTLAPPVDPVLRKRLEEEYDLDGGIALYERLKTEDPETAAAFHPNNKPYLIRAMEILESTGERPSSFKQKSECPYDLLIFGMDIPREELNARIDKRTNTLLNSGWKEEVATLLANGFTVSDPGFASVGYREIANDEPNVEELIASKTRKYAKRQMTWWRGDERIRWTRG